MASRPRAARRRVARAALAALAGCVAFLMLPPSASGQPGPRAAAPPPGGAPDLPTRMLRNGLFLLAGPGGNSMVRFSANGVILVDGQPAGSDATLRASIRHIARFADLPVRVLVLTSAGANHAGTCADTLARHAALVVQAATRAALPAACTPARADKGALQPFDAAFTVRLGGVTAQALHVGNGPEDGATVVHFADLRVVAIGDLAPAGLPLPADDRLAGASAALGRVLALDFDLAVPGMGPPLLRPEVLAYRARLDARLSARP